MPILTKYLKLKKPIKATEIADIDILNENTDVIDNELKKQNENINSKEPIIIKKSGFNLDKTDNPENNSNKLFTSKGAFNLKNSLENSIASKTDEKYVDKKISDLVGSSPTTLDTLNELAEALGNDANFSTTILNKISKLQDDKFDKSGGTITGALTVKNDLYVEKDIILKKESVIRVYIDNIKTWAIGFLNDTFYLGILNKKLQFFSNSNPTVRVIDTISTLYHTNNKPTAKELGAVNINNAEITSCLKINKKQPLIKFIDSRNGNQTTNGYIGYGSDINKLQIVNYKSNSSLELGANGNLYYNNLDIINKEVSIFYKKTSGTTSGNYTSGYNIDIFKDFDTNECDIIFSSVDNSLTITKSGRYEIMLKTYINISEGEWTEYGVSTQVKTLLTLNTNTILLYSEYSVNRNSCGYTKIINLHSGDKIRFNITRFDSAKSVLLYNGEDYNSLTFKRIGG